jgi:hypothetical protein
MTKKILIPTFFLIYLFIGLFIYNDYGIGIEEHFQRQNGFYWTVKIFSYLGVDSIKIHSLDIYQSIRSYDPNLPDSNFFNYYGITFDTTLAFVETVLKMNDSKLYFELRHLTSFIIFFISSVFFYKILKNRFKNDIVTYLGTSFYILNPRIFGDSFHNNKDVFFLSILTIALFYLFQLLEKNNTKSVILFCLFAAIATSSRIMGIYLPLLFIFFLFLDYLSQKIFFGNFLKKTLTILSFYIFFLYLHYPYMWELNIFKFIEWFSVYFYNMDLKILYSGEYYHIKYLPRLYLPVWISITTPIFILLLFIGGYLFMFKRFFQRLINIKLDTMHIHDFWSSVSEKKDIFIFFSVTSFLMYAIFLNVAMLSGWRHFYFLHVFIIYAATYMLNLLLTAFKKKKIKVFYFKLINLIFVSIILFDLSRFHPYQSLYFNSLINKENIKNFPVDTPSLSRSDALKYIISLNKTEDKIFVSNASWTPFHNGKDLLKDYEQKKLIFVGQDYNKADYIYTNFNYEVDPKLNKKYNIPKDFKEIKKVIISDIPIYSIYKRIN